MNFMNKKIVIVQPALPKYRIDFFERLYKEYGESFKVYYASSDLNVKSAEKIIWASCSGEIKKLFFGFFIQPGIRLNLSPGDVVVISGNIKNLSFLRFFILSRLRGASVLWWGHFSSAGGSRLGLLLRSFFMLLSDAVIFYVDTEVHRFRSSLSYIRCIPIVCSLNNGIDISYIRELRLNYSSTSRDIDFIFIGRLTDKASVSLVIEAMNLIENKVTFHIVGDGALKFCLTEKARSLGLSNQITWHGAIDDEKTVSRLMNRSKVFVYAGGVGLSLIHAMSYGLPAILHSSSHNHMPEFDAFEDGVTGFSFEFNNSTSLSKAMKTALSDITRLSMMSRNAIDKIGPDFTTEGMARRFLALIKRL